MAVDWTVDHTQSKLGFVATYDGVGFTTQFEKFDATIHFDPKALETSQFRVTVSLGSVNSRSTDRDEGMQDTEWFDVAHYPEATFVSKQVTKNGDDEFAVTGDLSIKDISREIVFPFKWTATDNGAKLIGETIVKRTDFKIGTGEWEKDETIGFDVKVIVGLILTRSG